jgi:VCBS repeat-containing protein
LGVVAALFAGMTVAVLPVTAAHAVPVNGVPGPQSTNENTSLVFSAANSNAITLSDADNVASDEQVELTVSHGTLTLGSESGVVVTGDGSADVMVTAPVDAINSALDGLTYAPTQFFHGSDSVTMNTSDLGNGTAGGPFTDMSSVGITVNETVAPTAVADSFSTNENVALTSGNVLANDTEPDGDTLSAVKVTDPANGNLTLNADGSFTYTPNNNFHGSDSFTYKANDGTLDSNTVQVSISVTETVTPTAIADSFSTNENVALTSGNVLTNDIEPDGDTLSAVKVTDPANGNLTLNADGSFTYTPNNNFHGSDSFTYKANDGTLDSNTVQVSISVTETVAPVAVGDSFQTNENVAINNGQVLTNDTDADGDTLHAVQVTAPANGLLTFHADGTFVYTPNQFFHGNDSFTYKANDGTLDSNVVTVSILVLHVNQPPVGNDDFYSIKENQTLSGNVVANDTDVDGTGLTALLQDSPTHANNFTLHSDGTFAYTPELNYHGTDSFTYFAYDGRLTSSLVTVHINVTFVNHPPVGVNDSFSINENGTLSGNVVANDTDVDGQSLTAFLNDSPTNDANFTLHTNGTFAYSPNAGFVGTDTFTYFASDGQLFSNLATVTITVNPVPGAPTNVTPTSSGNGSATLTWTAAAGNGAPITGYIVTPYIGFAALPSQTFNSAATTETVTGLTNGTSYVFRVAAVNAFATGPMSTASASIAIGLPAAPTGVAGTPGNATASVTWTAPSGNGSSITGYVVTPFIGTTAQPAQTFNSTMTTETVTGLTNGTAYTFKVAAINGVGTGPQSAASAPVTVGAPTAPRTPTATALAKSAKVKWTAPASNNGSSVKGYTVTVYSGGVVVKAVVFNNTNTTQTITGLTTGQSYTFTVAARNAKGTGPQSVMTNAVTPT